MELMVLPFYLSGQDLRKAPDFPVVAEKNRNYLKLKVNGIPEGVTASAYFTMSWDTQGDVYDVLMTDGECVVPEALVTLPSSKNDYVDYKLLVSIKTYDSVNDIRQTSNIAEIVIEPSVYSDSTENTPVIPSSQFEQFIEQVEEQVGDIVDGKLENLEIDTDQIKNSAVTTAKINNGAVTEGKIGSGAVTTEKIANGAVTERKIGTGAVTTAKLFDGAVTHAKLGNDVSAFQHIEAVYSDSGDFPMFWINGEGLNGDFPFLAAFEVEQAIADNNAVAFYDTSGSFSFSTWDLRDTSQNEIKFSDLTPGWYFVEFAENETATLLNKSIGVADGAITTPKLADDAVTAAKIKNANVTANKIASGAVTNAKLADGAVSTDKIGDGAVTDIKLDAIIRSKINAMYTIVQAAYDSSALPGFEYSIYTGNDKVKVSLYNGHAVIGVRGGGSANALWDSQSLVIPAYIIWPDDYTENAGKVFEVKEIADSALYPKYVYDTGDATLYIPKTVDTFGNDCFGFAGATTYGKLYIVADNVTVPSSAMPGTDYTVLRKLDEFTILDYYTKAEIDEKLAGRLNGWDDIKYAIRLGLGEALFPVGYEFSTPRETANSIIWVVRGHDHHAAADGHYVHTMTLEAKYVYGTAAGTYKGLAFDAAEALYYCSEALPAGTYNFTWNYATGSMVNGTYQFTLTEGVPAGGQIVLGTNSSSTAITSCKIKTYGSVGSNTAIESNIAVTEGSGGTSLGTVNASSSTDDNLNCGQRVLFGSNNYAQSAARQWLNSAEKLGSVWSPTNKFDRAPSWHTGSDSAYRGFMHGLGDDFLGAVQPAKIACRTNSVFEVDSLDGTEFTVNQVYELKDKFFLLSRPEIYGNYDSTSYKDGTQLEYYEDLTQTELIKRVAAGSARYAWLRSPGPSNAGTERIVDTDGGLSNRNAVYAHAVAPACIIA